MWAERKKRLMLILSFFSAFTTVGKTGTMDHCQFVKPLSNSWRVFAEDYKTEQNSTWLRIRKAFFMDHRILNAIGTHLQFAAIWVWSHCTFLWNPIKLTALHNWQLGLNLGAGNEYMKVIFHVIALSAHSRKFIQKNQEENYTKDCISMCLNSKDCR